MAKLGNYEYPEIELTASLEVARRISKDFAGEVSRTGLARSLGMAERGGAFASRLTALRLWGISTGRSRIRLTPDGLKASGPSSPDESEPARRALAESVPLFVELGNRIGWDSYGAGQLAVLVEEITGAKRDEVERRLATLDRVFSEVRQLLAGDRVSARPAGGEVRAVGVQAERVSVEQSGDYGRSAAVAVEETVSAVAPTDGRIEVKLPNGCLSLPETVENLDLALTVLLARRKSVADQMARTGSAV